MRWSIAAVLLAACGTSELPAPAAMSPAAAPSSPVSPTGAGVERLVALSGMARPEQPDMAPRFQAALVEDYCVDRDVSAPGATDITLTVLDRTYALPPDYVPGDLVPAAEAGFDGTSGAKLVSAAVVEDLAAIRAATEAAGLTILIESAYRSYADQAATFDSWVARLGYAGGLLRSARPGHSEHQLGTAMDLVSPGWSGRVGDWAVESEEGAWMAEHAWKYGFVMTFPAGGTPETCLQYEPWHYRWVGRDVAARHRASGLTLRRYLDRYVTG